MLYGADRKKGGLYALSASLCAAGRAEWLLSCEREQAGVHGIAELWENHVIGVGPC